MGIPSHFIPWPASTSTLRILGAQDADMRVYVCLSCAAHRTTGANVPAGWVPLTVQPILAGPFERSVPCGDRRLHPSINSVLLLLLSLAAWACPTFVMPHLPAALRSLCGKDEQTASTAVDPWPRGWPWMDRQVSSDGGRACACDSDPSHAQRQQSNLEPLPPIARWGLSACDGPITTAAPLSVPLGLCCSTRQSGGPGTGLPGRYPGHGDPSQSVSCARSGRHPCLLAPPACLFLLPFSLFPAPCSLRHKKSRLFARCQVRSGMAAGRNGAAATKRVLCASLNFHLARLSTALRIAIHRTSRV